MKRGGRVALLGGLLYLSLCGCQAEPTTSTNAKKHSEMTRQEMIDRPTPFREEVDQVTPIRDQVLRNSGMKAALRY